MATDVAAAAVRGAWFKHTYPGSQPLPEREPPPDNRWQRGDAVDALYLAEAEETTWAEWYRHLAERMIPPLAQMPRELWTWRVDVEVAERSPNEPPGGCAGLGELRRLDRGPQDVDRRLVVEAGVGAEEPSLRRLLVEGLDDHAGDLVSLAQAQLGALVGLGPSSLR